MTTEEVASMVAEIGLPYAYYEFQDDTAHKPPFCCFMFTDTADSFADNQNYTDIKTLVIELYTAAKSYELENRVRAVLLAHELPFRADFTKIDAENLYITTYTTEVLLNGK